MNIPRLTPIKPRMGDHDLHPAHDERKEAHRRDPVSHTDHRTMPRRLGVRLNGPRTRSPHRVSDGRNYTIPTTGCSYARPCRNTSVDSLSAGLSPIAGRRAPGMVRRV